MTIACPAPVAQIKTPQLNPIEKKILRVLKKHEGVADVGTLLDSGLNRYHDSFSLQKQLTPLCRRGLIMRLGIHVILLE